MLTLDSVNKDVKDAWMIRLCTTLNCGFVVLSLICAPTPGPLLCQSGSCFFCFFLFFFCDTIGLIAVRGELKLSLVFGVPYFSLGGFQNCSFGWLKWLT